MEGGPPSFPQGSTCPVVLRYRTGLHHSFAYRALTFCGVTFQSASTRAALARRCLQTPPCDPTTPRTQRLQASARTGFGLFPFRSPLLGESILLSLPPGTKMFQFPGFPPRTLCVQVRVTAHVGRRVAPFGYPRIKACLRLPEAFRSLLRPSSAPGAKASTMCPL